MKQQKQGFAKNVSKRYNMSGLKDKIKKEAKGLQERLKIANVWALPRINKIVVNVGLGRAVVASAKPEDVIKRVSDELGRITGQKPVVTQAKKAIASFKTRIGMRIGLKVTLHGPKMYDFLEGLIKVALPRTRDFRGVKESSVDAGGNLNVGIKDHTVFPEASADAANSFSLEFTVTVFNSDRANSLEFFRTLGFPFEKKTNK